MKNLIEWSKAVRDRDLKCMHCDSDHDLHAHHIKPKSTHPELKLEISNGITLCYRCHKAEHERNRPVRIRANAPQRRTLTKKINELEHSLDAANACISKLEEINKTLNKEINSLNRTRSMLHYLETNKKAKEILMNNGWDGFMK